jgi:spore germination protein
MDTYRRFLSRVTQAFPLERMVMGIRNIGYVWRLPYIPNVSRGMAVSYNAAVDIARVNNAIIEYDEITNVAYFTYATDFEYIVRFWDARSIDAYVKLVPEFGFNGVTIWNIMSFLPQMWMVINSKFEIKKVLE